MGWFLVVALGILGSAIVQFNFAPLVFQLYMFGLLLGTIYSVPPLRLKRSPLAAFLIIATVRGFLLNFGCVFIAFEFSIRDWFCAILYERATG